MPGTRARIVGVLFALTLAAPMFAQDIRQIYDRSVARDRYERAVHVTLEIDGQRVDLVFQRETVPGSVFLRVTQMPGARSAYRYLGVDGGVLRLRLEGAVDEPAVLSYPARADGGFVIIPDELQHTRFRFDLRPIAERGVVQAVLLDNGQPR